jgi:Bacterial Ig domain
VSCVVATTVRSGAIDGSAWRARTALDDGKGSVAEDTVTVTVNAVNHAPVCGPAALQEVTASANHAHNAIPVGGIHDPDGDALTIAITGVQMDEPDAFGATYPFAAQIVGTGVGTAASDGFVPGLVQVRGERNGTRQAPGNGRVYHILFTADDGRGGVCSADLRVGVRFAVTQPPVDNHPAVSKNALLANPQ